MNQTSNKVYKKRRFCHRNDYYLGNYFICSCLIESTVYMYVKIQGLYVSGALSENMLAHVKSVKRAQ
jgi:hypothetical protein